MSELTTGRGTPFVPGWTPEVAPTLNAHFGDKMGLENQHALSGAGLFQPVAFHNRQDPDISGDVTHPLGRMDNGMAIAFEEGQDQPAPGTMQVRRLTVEECELLMGFPRGFTRISWRGKKPENCPTGLRYKALGNSMAVNCMEWIGRRIVELDR